MNILYIANIRLPTEKAHGIQIMKMCEAFAILGHKVELVVPNRRTPITEDPFTYYGVEQNFTITKLPTLDTVSLGRIGFWLQTLSFIIGAARYVRRSPAEVVYSRDPALFFFDQMPAAKKLVWEVHTKPTQRVAEKIRKSRVRIVAISGGLRDVLVEADIPRERIIVAHDAVDADLFAHAPDKVQARAELALPTDEKLVAYVGKYKTMGESKGVEDIIVAVGEVHASDPSVGLLVVGLNEDEFSEARALAARAGLGDSAHLVGHVSRADIPRYLRAADVLVMNYPNTEHYACYMSPLKLFEYMASGVPIVSSDLPSIREVLNDASVFFFRINGLDTLRQAVEIALSNTIEASRKAIVASEKVKEYSWQRRSEAILKFLT